MSARKLSNRNIRAAVTVRERSQSHFFSAPTAGYTIARGRRRVCSSREKPSHSSRSTGLSAGIPYREASGRGVEDSRSCHFRETRRRCYFRCTNRHPRQYTHDCMEIVLAPVPAPRLHYVSRRYRFAKHVSGGSVVGVREAVWKARGKLLPDLPCFLGRRMLRDRGHVK